MERKEETSEFDPFARERRTKGEPFGRKSVTHEVTNAETEGNDGMKERTRGRRDRYVTFSIFRDTIDKLKVVQAVLQIRSRRSVSMNDMLSQFTDMGIRELYPEAWPLIEGGRARDGGSNETDMDTETTEDPEKRDDRLQITESDDRKR